mgnify:CR=1 FL=1
MTLSVTKLLSRIVKPSAREKTTFGDDVTNHDRSYGITSDPLTQFACAFSALIHDVDHKGVPNSQLIVENAKLGEYYKKRSVAEQNSFDLAWDMLMDERYLDLLQRPRESLW